MNQEAVERKPQQNPESEIKLTGRVLWLTKAPELIRQQIQEQAVDFIIQDQHTKSISTDEIIKSRHCFLSSPKELGKHCLEGVGGLKEGEVQNGNYDLLVSDNPFASGSSREHAAIAVKGAGIKFVFGRPIERIFLQNAINIGLLPIQDEEILRQLLTKKTIDPEKIAQQFDPITAGIIRAGGLLPYLAARLESKVKLPEIKTPPHPMTMSEKIIAQHLVTNGSVSVEAVKPGDAGFVKADFMYGYELSTPLGETSLKEAFGENYEILEPELIALFEDHTALLEAKTSEIQNQVLKLISAQRGFARKHFIHRYSPDAGICHNVVVENHALPGQLILGTDSHTCSAGVVGAFADGIGATEMAGAWLTGDVRITVPATWRFNINYSPKPNVTAKDVMLYILSCEKVKNGLAVGKVFEFAGEGLTRFSFDELFVLANMAVEGGAFTGIVEPNDVVIDYLFAQYPKLSHQQLESMIVKSDKDAEFEATFEINLDEIPPMVALPGDPRNGVPLSEVVFTKTDAVYIGSCTGGKLEDLKRVAQVLAGKKIKIPTYVQASSLLIRAQAEKLGLIETIRKSGATILDSGCGDCCNLGFGIVEEGGTIVSDTNRNFPGRMGKNNVYLVNPFIAANTALTGYLPKY